MQLSNGWAQSSIAFTPTSTSYQTYRTPPRYFNANAQFTVTIYGINNYGDNTAFIDNVLLVKIG